MVMLDNKLIKNRVLVIGDIMLDTYVEGDVERLSPEAPVPVLLQRSELSFLGGAGNVALNLKKLEVDVALAGILGTDKASERILELCLDNGINHHLLHEDNFLTTQKIRFTSGGQQLLRHDIEGNLNVNLDSFSGQLEKQLTNFDVVVLSDYNKGMSRMFPAIIEAATSLNKVVCVDPKNCDWEIYKGAHVITPNLTEFRNCTLFDPKKSEKANALAIMKKYRIGSIFLTKSAGGITYYDSARYSHAPTVAIDVFDVTGAGDTVISIISAFINRGLEINELLELSNFAASISVSKKGAYAVSWSEIKSAFSRKNKNLSKKTKTVFTNGCFDILHYGHICFLRECANLGDRLVVGLNSDDSVRRLKGASRPINSQQDRKEVLSALSFVDEVIIFDEDTPLDLIKRIKPDILAKGSDYKVDQIAGGDYVRDLGGEVVLVDYVNNYSTSKIVKKIIGD